MKTLTYGVVPPLADFDEAFERDADLKREGYSWLLKGTDEATAYRYDIPTMLLAADSDEMSEVVTTLADAWSKGDEEAGDLAASILTSLGFEWV